MSHFRGFYTRDYQTFGMEVEVSTQAYRKLKKSITRKKILNRYGREITADVAPYIRVAAIMREAHWLVSENHSFSKFQIDDGPVIYIEYPEGTIEYRKPTQRKESTRMTDKQQIIMIPLDLLEPHPDNPRKDVGDVSELAESVKAHGILQNLTVVGSPDDKDKFRVIIGHRRLAAAKLAGLTQVPCVISDMDYAQQIRTMLTENMQRSDLTYYEQAQGFQMMLDLGDSVEQIAERAGFSTSTVRRRLKMAELDSKVLKKVSSDGRQLSLADFDRLAEIDDLELRNKALQEIGTNNFEYTLNRAKNEDAAKKRLPEVLEWLKAHNAKEIDSAEANGRKYESLYCGKNRVYYGSLYLADKGAPKMPPDDGVKDVAISYVIALPYVRLYMPATSYTNTGKKSREVLDREKLARETKAEILRIAAEHYDLRKGFMGRANFGKADREKILAGTTYLTFYFATGWGGCHSDEAMKKLGIQSYASATEKFYNAIVQLVDGKDYKKLAAAVYDCFCDKADETFAAGMGSTGYVPSYDATHNTKLTLLYRWLESLGYEPCEEEKQMIDGSHELYHKGGK